MKCNIDAVGKAKRLRAGFITLAVTGVFVGVALTTGQAWAWYTAAGCFAGAALCIFQARAGWCVFRAMGFKTKV